MDKKDFTTKQTGKTVQIGGGYCAFVPCDLPPSFTCQSEILNLIDQSMLALGELRATIPYMPNPRLLTYPFLRREAVLSSKIEGTHTELEQLYLFEVDTPDDQAAKDSESFRDAREVHNYVLALEHGLDKLANDELPICNRLLKEMHKILMDDVSEERGKYKRPGEFREDQAFIGSSDLAKARYVAPPASTIDPLMAALEKYLHTPAKYHPTLIRIALAHYQFEAIHPFVDGNGRIGRLLISLLLASWGVLPQPLLYLSAYFERHVDEYRQRLWHVSRHGDWEGYLKFFLVGVREEARDATDRAKSVINLREEYRQQFQLKRGATSVLALVDYLFTTPFVTVTRAAQILGITYNAAKKNVDKLTEAGILLKYDESAWRSLYVARPILDRMQAEKKTA